MLQLRTRLQYINFNINNEFTIFGEDVLNTALHSTCIKPVVYEVLDNTSTVVGVPKQLLTISDNGCRTDVSLIVAE